MTALTLQNISYKYKKSDPYVLDGVSAEFSFGKIYAITGASGTGKSTLLSLIAGLDVAYSGAILYKGDDLSKMNRDIFRRNHVGFVYQSLNLIPHLTASENIVIMLELSCFKGDFAKRANDLMNQVNLDLSLSKKYPSQLSGGECQRVAIARTLAGNADVLLIDEPTGSLDSSNAQNIMQILKDIAHNKSKCVIVASHDEDIISGSDIVFSIKDKKMFLSPYL